MPTLEILNNIDHRDLRIDTSRSDANGDGYMCVPTFPREFRAVQAHYPIVFAKNAKTGVFTPLALFGLQEMENLFIKDGRWDCRYIPLCAEAKPFLIGEGRNDLSSVAPQRVIHVDRESPKLRDDFGVKLFKELGGNSDFLDRISEVLSAINEGIGEVKPFCDLLVKFDLLEPFAVEATLAKGKKFSFQGFYVINEERLSTLSGENIATLHASGFLFDIYMLLASLTHFSDLFDRKSASISE